MTSLIFKQPALANQTKFIYKDLHLDIVEDITLSKSNYTKTDIKVDYDVAAIKNAIVNIFNTKKGQRPLYPDFGISLEQYLFQPVNRQTAYLIGYDIEQGLKLDDRIVPLQINVSILESEDGYQVDLALFIPSLSINTRVYGSLTSENGLQLS